MKRLFGNWQFLKCGAGNYNFARVTGFILSCIVQPGIILYVVMEKEITDITNIWQWLFIATPILFTTFIFGLDVIRENKDLSIRINGKDYGFNKSENVLK